MGYERALTTGAQDCIMCHQPLPRNSKLTVTFVSSEEAVQNGWTGESNQDGTVSVPMCLQCQIERSKHRKPSA